MEKDTEQGFEMSRQKSENGQYPQYKKRLNREIM
jgi:hypothetical protein